MMQKILISACLLGEHVTYDERSNLLDNALLKQWLAEGRVVPACPEVAGGLPTPRPAAERAFSTEPRAYSEKTAAT